MKLCLYHSWLSLNLLYLCSFFRHLHMHPFLTVDSPLPLLPLAKVIPLSFIEIPTLECTYCIAGICFYIGPHSELHEIRSVFLSCFSLSVGLACRNKRNNFFNYFPFVFSPLRLLWCSCKHYSKNFSFPYRIRWLGTFKFQLAPRRGNEEIKNCQRILC